MSSLLARHDSTSSLEGRLLGGVHASLDTSGDGLKRVLQNHLDKSSRATEGALTGEALDECT